MSYSLLVRPDGGPAVGSGHIARCYALAEAWVRRGNGRATVWCDQIAEPWRERFESIGVAVSATRPAVDFDWIAVDGYSFTARDHEYLRELGTRMLAIDDFGSGGVRRADLVVDQNHGARRDLYDTDRALLGARYALIRKEFLAVRPSEDTRVRIATRLVVLGGGSPSSAIRSFLEAVRTSTDLARLEPVELSNQQAVAATLASTDLAVSAAGSTVYELCCIGVPAIVVVVAANQRPGALALHADGVVVSAGELETLSPSAVAAAAAALADDMDARSRMRSKALRLVDGLGAARAVTAMRSALVDLRPAAADDARALFEWRNEAETRRWSFSGASVGWDEHEGWLHRRLVDPDTRLFIVEDEQSRPCGQIRFDISPSHRQAEMSVGLAPDARGLGLAAAAIDAGVRRMFVETSVDEVIARIKPGNGASIHSFVAADFDRDDVGSSDDALLYSRSHDATRV